MLNGTNNKRVINHIDVLHIVTNNGYAPCIMVK